MGFVMIPDFDDKDRKSEAVPINPANSDQLGAQFGLVIGKALKAHYDDLVEAPIPDKFMDLLAQLEASGGKKP